MGFKVQILPGLAIGAVYHSATDALAGAGAP